MSIKENSAARNSSDWALHNKLHWQLLTLPLVKWRLTLPHACVRLDSEAGHKNQPYLRVVTHGCRESVILVTSTG